jgi:ribonuclease HI
MSEEKRSQTEFIAKISPERKKIRELKFDLYVYGTMISENVGGWAFHIINKQDQSSLLSGTEQNTNEQRIKLFPIIEGIKWIVNNVERKYRKYIQITIHSESIFSVNLIKEWIGQWVSEDVLETKPNADMLKEIYEYIKQVQISAKCSTKLVSPYLFSLESLVNKQI